MVLETKRLILRPWSVDDAEELYLYASDPDIGPSAGWLPHKNVEDSRTIIQTVLASHAESYAICLKPDNQVIGAIALNREHFPNVEEEQYALGFWIAKPFWGQHLIPEASRELLRYAFEDLGLAKVYCAYYEGNTRSQRVQEKLGFKHQWTTKGVKLRSFPEPRTRYVNAMTREEWLSAQENGIFRRE